MCCVKPPSALAVKGAAVEEWVDLRFYRPLGLRLARALLPTGVSADEVTIWALMVGLLAGHMFLYVDWRVNALGFGLLIVSDILDSADGQLARLRGTSTRLGRSLDGVSDALRFANLYIHLSLRLFLAGHGWEGILLGVFAGFSHSLQSSAVDFIRNAYLYAGLRTGELDLPEDLTEAPPTGWFSRFATYIYHDYVSRQVRVFPRSTRLVRLMRRVRVGDAFRAEYQDRQGRLLPVCTWLGQNIRFGLVGVAAMAGHPSIYLWTEVSVMNAVWLILVLIHEWNATALGESLRGGANAYA